MLANVLEELKPADWIAPRRCKESREIPGQKAKLEFDDILSMIIFPDENARWSRA